MKNKILLFFLVLLIAQMFINYASAAKETDGSKSASVSFQLKNPLKAKTIEDLITSVIKLMMQIGLSVAVLFIVYAGFLFVTAGGNTEKVTQAKQVLLWAVIGAAVLLGSLVIMSVIQNTIKEVTTVQQ